MQVGLIKDKPNTKKIPLMDVKFTHALCIGQTGSGKTTSFIYPNLKERLKQGHGILFFDIKGNEHLSIKLFAKEAGRLNDVVEIGKPWGPNLDILRDLNTRSFDELLESLVGDAKSAGQNSFFHNAAQKLGMTLFNIIKKNMIIKKEFLELDLNEKLGLKFPKYSSLTDIYEASASLKSLIDFLDVEQEFVSDLLDFIAMKANLFNDPKSSDLFKNIVLNYHALKTMIDSLSAYRDLFDDAENRTKELHSVINTLHNALGFMVSYTSKYISDSSSNFNIAQALQDGKIVCVNVRAIDDTVLSLILETTFDQLLERNMSKTTLNPITFFIDEAQRLIKKDIPLDVLRSTKVDVVMAVQSEKQLITKFKSLDAWHQISVNIGQKVAFKSVYFGGDDLMEFYAPTATLKPFEYLISHDNKVYLADPIFVQKKELNEVEVEYQHQIMDLAQEYELAKDEYAFYDMPHFEKEREVLILDIENNMKRYKKIFSDHQERIILNLLSDYMDKDFANEGFVNFVNVIKAEFGIKHFNEQDNKMLKDIYYKHKVKDPKELIAMTVYDKPFEFEELNQTDAKGSKKVNEVDESDVFKLDVLLDDLETLESTLDFDHPISESLKNQVHHLKLTRFFLSQKYNKHSKDEYALREFQEMKESDKVLILDRLKNMNIYFLANRLSMVFFLDKKVRKEFLKSKMNADDSEVDSDLC